MFNLPTPRLGEISAFTISTPDLEKSLTFYQQLGYQEVMRMDFPFPWIQISDGAVLIMLRKDSTPYIALTYYVKDIDKVVNDLEKSGIMPAQKPKPTDMIKRYVYESPDGVNISLVNIMEGFKQPPGPTMLTLPQRDYFNPEKYGNKIAGLYGEFAQPVKNLDTSTAFWEKLGFVVLSRHEMPYPWAILSDGLSIVGLHQSQHFSQPTITYFAADMKDKVEKLVSEGLTDYEERGGKANIVVTTPEKQKINLFKLGV